MLVDGILYKHSDVRACIILLTTFHTPPYIHASILQTELMPLECLCRLVNASSESRVSPYSTSLSSVELVAYTELLRSVTARLSGTTMETASPMGVGAVGSHPAAGVGSGSWVEGVRELDLGALFR